ncbi:major facilitator superfamily domain-containing protein [Scheffersomyces xylosifermentans]|uniref:major facilitator superfamily domain-containing protein n=1 Tax=Scheffersomyces xylosifermentans TaxID=1304137 RepID=UPI00315CEA74
MEPRPAIFKSGIHEVSLVTLVCLAQFLTQSGITMSLSTMNKVLDSFASFSGDSQIDDSKKVWFMGSFALTVGTFILLSGKLGDLFGLKLVFCIGWFWVAIWSLITGLSIYSHSIIFFIISRAFQGIGFALLLPCGMGILGSVYQNGDRKNFAFGSLGASGPTGATIGAIMAAIIGQKAWWPWAFWVLAIVSFALGVLSIFAIPANLNAKSHTAKEAWEQLDVCGSIVGIVGLILFNFVWNQGSVVGWSEPYIITLLVVSVLLIVLFFYLQLNVAKHPLLPKSIFTIRIGLVLACVGLGWGSFGIWQYYYWNIILNLRHYTPIEGSLTYIPIFVFGIIASLVVSVIIARTKPSYIICFATTCFMVGCIMLSVTPIHQSYFQITMGQMFILCWGMDMSFPAASILLSDYLPDSNQGMAGSLVATVVNYSVSLFLGMATTVEVETLKHASVLESYHAAIYLGIGVAGLGVLFSAVFIVLQLNDGSGTFSPSYDEKENEWESS